MSKDQHVSFPLVHACDPTNWQDRVDTVLSSLARRTVGLTGADIEQLVRRARGVARREKRQLTYAHLDQVLRASRPRRSDEAIFRAANHEAAHAVARVYLNSGSTTQITINGIGGNAFVAGYHEGLETVTEEGIMAQLIVLLAGRAAEEEFCGSVSAHSGGNKYSDLAQATELAYALEMSSGLGRQQPLVYREVNNVFELLNQNPRLSDLINERLKVCYEAAKKIVVRLQKAIEYLAGCLLMWETLDGALLERVLSKVKEIVEAS